MQTLNDVHQQFAEYFDEPDLKPYLYTLSRKMSEGHICIETDHIDPELLPESYRGLTVKTIPLNNHLIGQNEAAYKPFVLDNGRLYLHRYFHYETLLITRIKTLLRVEEPMVSERLQALTDRKSFIAQLFRNDDATYTDWQLAAAITAVLGNFTIITGGPGTGKTTTVAKILALLFNMEPSMKVALAAPTGKAGARMAESLVNAPLDMDEATSARFQALKPATIHRMLGWQKGSPYFRHNAAHPLPYDLVVVDESSMIDVALFAKLLDALKPGSRVILLGDKDQLASVEAGSLFGDLCKAAMPLNTLDNARRTLINTFITGKERQIPESVVSDRGGLSQHLVELRYSHRFKGEEGIGRLSRAVINNDIPALHAFLTSGPQEQVVIDQLYSATIFETFIDGYKDYINTPDIYEAIQKFNNLRILCALRQGDQGIHNMNALTEAYLIRTGYLKRDSEFYNNRPVMVMQNDYTLGLYNGDIGILRKDAQGTMKAWFIDTAEGGESKLKSVLPGFISGMETVFAMTIHKSQGSEFGSVMVVLPAKTDVQMVTRELLYTGITRARHKVIIQSTSETLLAAADKIVERGSGVVSRMNPLS